MSISEIFKLDNNIVNNEEYIIENFDTIKENIFDYIQVFTRTEKYKILQFITPEINYFLKELDILTKTNKSYTDVYSIVFSNLLILNMNQFLNELNSENLTNYINEFISIVEVDNDDLEEFIEHPKIQKELSVNSDNISFYDKKVLKFLNLLPKKLKSNTCVNVLFDESLNKRIDNLDYYEINEELGPLYKKIKKYIDFKDFYSIIELQPKIVYLIDDAESLNNLKNHPFKKININEFLNDHPILLKKNILNELKDDLKNKKDKKRRNI